MISWSVWLSIQVRNRARDALKSQYATVVLQGGVIMSEPPLGRLRFEDHLVVVAAAVFVQRNKFKSLRSTGQPKDLQALTIGRKLGFNCINATRAWTAAGGDTFNHASLRWSEHGLRID
jgi:hypothetical protein